MKTLPETEIRKEDGKVYADVDGRSVAYVNYSWNKVTTYGCNQVSLEKAYYIVKAQLMAIEQAMAIVEKSKNPVSLEN